MEDISFWLPRCGIEDPNEAVEDWRKNSTEMMMSHIHPSVVRMHPSWHWKQ